MRLFRWHLSPAEKKALRLRRRVGGIPKRFGVVLPDDAEARAHRREVEAYWERHFGRPVDASWHLLFSELGAERDVRFIPSHEWWEDVLPFLNDRKMRPAFSDKNLSDALIAPKRAPVTLLKRIRGRYYGSDDAPVSSDDAVRFVAAGSSQLVIKPSRSADGDGVRAFENDGRTLFAEGHAWSFADLEATYGADFLVQERIAQHAVMAAVHPASVNTIRVVTLRFGGVLEVQTCFARFGTAGRATDNAGTGGFLVNIGSNGRLEPRAVDLAGREHEKHPDTGHAFGEPFDVPGFDAIRLEALRLHGRLHHLDLASWDFAVAEDGEPIFLEVNFRGMGDAYQFVPQRPLFGDRTPEILEAIRAARPSQ